MRVAMTTAIVLSLASPVLADCGEELSKLKQAAVTAETGASTETPATKHQEEVLSGKQQTESKETTGVISGEVEAVSPHQKQVTGEAADKSGDIGQMMADARKLADSGDEQGCMSKVGELKEAMGIK